MSDLLAEPPVGEDGAFLAAVVRRLRWIDEGPTADDSIAGAGPRVRAAVPPSGWRHLDALEVVGPAAGVGSPDPALVIVGERAHQPGQVPFDAPCGTWLWGALRLLGWDELRCRVTNALPPGKGRRGVKGWRRGLADLQDVLGVGEVKPPVHPGPPVWLALGKEARRALQAVPHVGAPHPQWARRFRRKEGIRGYADRLERAGLPRGPGIPKDVGPETPADDPPGSLREAVGLGTRSLLLRMRAGAGDPTALKQLEAMRRSGDTGAKPLHPSPNALKILAQAAALEQPAAPRNGAGPLEEAELRRRTALADRYELDVERQRDGFFSRAEVQEGRVRRVHALKRAFEALPHKLEGLTATEIRRELDDVLEAFAEGKE